MKEEEESMSTRTQNRGRTANPARIRWRMANRAIFATRAITSRIDDNHISVVHASAAPFEVDYPNIPQPESNLSINLHQRVVSMVKNKDLAALQVLGGVKGVASTLGTDPEIGIRDNEDIEKRREMFGPNNWRKGPRKGFLYFVVDALKDLKLLVLLALDALTLGFGIKERGGRKCWYDGVGIFIFVLIYALWSAFSNFRQEIQLQNLSEMSKMAEIEVIRGGRRRQISVFDVVVGEVLLLKIGDQVPADGLFLSGHCLQVKDSNITGESGVIQIDSTEHPFLSSGLEVVDGCARMLVSSVGINEQWGSPSCGWKERTPLQDQLAKQASFVKKVGLTVASLFLVVMIVYYIKRNKKHGNRNLEHNGKRTDTYDVFIGVVQIVAVAVANAVVADPQGLPSAVTLTVAYTLRNMMADKVLLRKFSACEAMASATTICADKTGTLTLNQMTVLEFWSGQELLNPFDEKSIDLAVRDLFCQGVGLNTTGSVYESVSGSETKIEFAGTPTEKALVSWASQCFGMDMEKLKCDYEVLRVETFNSEKKRGGILLRKNIDGTMYVHWKGAPEMVLEMCSTYYESNGRIQFLDEDARNRIRKIIEGRAASGLRCIAFAYCQILESEQMEYIDENQTQGRLKEDRLSLLGIVGIQDPCQPGIKNVVEVCKAAGVSVKMVTGDNIFAAKAIATECGILEPTDQLRDGKVVEGIVFRNYTNEQRMQSVERISVMARSLPSDKALMIQCLKQNGHVVAAAGDGTPALLEANIGLSMGIQGTEAAKQSSDVVILDNNFNSVVEILRWGRSVYYNIQKFIQFQLALTFSALTINIIAAIAVGEIPLTTVQLLWVTLIISVVALAFAGEPSTDELMHRSPVRTGPLITSIMWRNILAQSVFQIVTLLIIHFKGMSIFHVSRDVNSTLVFNTFVLCQVLNMFNSRKMDKMNVFKDIGGNKVCILIAGTTTILQVVIVEFLNKLANTRGLNVLQWLACILIAALTLPVGWIVKLIPVSDGGLDKLKKIVITSIVGAVITAIINALNNLHKKSD